MNTTVKDIGSRDDRPRLLAQHNDLGREVWIKWEGRDKYDEDGMYGLYASRDCDDPIGEADTVTDARRVAREWFKELMAY